MNVSVTIHKDQIARYHDLIGIANGQPVVIDGKEYGPGEIEFRGFIGRHIGDGLYAGSFGYGPADVLATRVDDFPTAEATSNAEQHDIDEFDGRIEEPDELD